MKRTIGILGLLVLLSGCAAGPKSDALTIYQASGLRGDLKDMSSEELTKFRATNDAPNPVPFVIDASMQLAHFYTPPPGFSFGGAAAMNILAFIPQPKDPSYYNRLFIWPTEEEVNRLCRVNPLSCYYRLG